MTSHDSSASQHLVVPIHLDALVVPNNRYVLGAMADFSRLPYFNGQQDVHPNIAYLSEEIVNHPFFDQNWTMKAGIHLHWALPDGLTKTMGLPLVRRQSFFSVFGPQRGSEIWEYLLNSANWLDKVDDYVARVVSRDGRSAVSFKYVAEQKQIEALLSHPTFPAVPNRWRVVRQKGDKTASWVIESDYLFSDKQHYHSENPTPVAGVPFPVEAEPLDSTSLPGVPFRYMGRRIAEADWSEGKTAAPNSYLTDPLTAVGYGEPNFAAFYPNCHSVFGFYDEIHDLTADLLKGTTYTIYGWYHHISQDYYNYFVTNFSPSPLDSRPKNIQLLEAIKRFQDLIHTRLRDEIFFLVGDVPGKLSGREIGVIQC